ncbi:MAG TPA: hypothetical protein VJ464_21450 [Blastocatellia bacterium]|nr:hypothetical protein [Blastocatellia bacterium]
MSIKNAHDLPQTKADIKAALKKEPQPSQAFCAVWPQAKQALTTLEGQVTNLALQRCIQAVIKAGDTYYQDTCPQ